MIDKFMSAKKIGRTGLHALKKNLFEEIHKCHVANTWFTHTFMAAKKNGRTGMQVKIGDLTNLVMSCCDTRFTRTNEWLPKKNGRTSLVTSAMTLCNSAKGIGCVFWSMAMSDEDNVKTHLFMLKKQFDDTGFMKLGQSRPHVSTCH